MGEINLTPGISEADKVWQQLEKSCPDIFHLVSNLRDSSEKTSLEINQSGELVGCNGETFQDTPRMRELLRIEALINATLAPVPNGYVRLWRGNRVGEVGLNPSYTSSLVGIALPFLMMYGGPLSYIDVPMQDLEKYLRSGGVAPGVEFMLPDELVGEVRVVGMSAQETVAIKSQSRPAQPRSDSWTSFTV